MLLLIVLVFIVVVAVCMWPMHVLYCLLLFLCSILNEFYMGFQVFKRLFHTTDS